MLEFTSENISSWWVFFFNVIQNRLNYFIDNKGIQVIHFSLGKFVSLEELVCHFGIHFSFFSPALYSFHWMQHLQSVSLLTMLEAYFCGLFSPLGDIGKLGKIE